VGVERRTPVVKNSDPSRKEKGRGSFEKGSREEKREKIGNHEREEPRDLHGKKKRGTNLKKGGGKG